jgi:hypothetical protein
MAAGPLELGLGLGSPGPSGPLPITSSRMGHLVDAFECAYRVLGFEDAAGGDEVFRHLVLARIIEPVGKLAFMAAHRLPDVTVVADAGMISEANQRAIEAAGLSFILGMKIPDVPYQVAQWRREHPGEDIPDGHVFTQPWPHGAVLQTARPGHLLQL